MLGCRAATRLIVLAVPSVLLLADVARVEAMPVRLPGLRRTGARLRTEQFGLTQKERKEAHAEQSAAVEASMAGEVHTPRGVKRRSASSSPERCTRRRFANGVSVASTVMAAFDLEVGAEEKRELSRPRRIYDVDTTLAPDPSKCCIIRISFVVVNGFTKVRP